MENQHITPNPKTGGSTRLAWSTLEQWWDQVQVIESSGYYPEAVAIAHMQGLLKAQLIEQSGDVELLERLQEFFSPMRWHRNNGWRNPGRGKRAGHPTTRVRIAVNNRISLLKLSIREYPSCLLPTTPSKRLHIRHLEKQIRDLHESEQRLHEVMLQTDPSKAAQYQRRLDEKDQSIAQLIEQAQEFAQYHQLTIDGSGDR